jgi:hypothetical protein
MRLYEQLHQPILKGKQMIVYVVKANGILYGIFTEDAYPIALELAEELNAIISRWEVQTEFPNWALQ